MTLTMVADRLAGGRATIEESLEGLRIEIPARRGWLTLAFHCVWLVGWAFGEAFAVGALLGVGWDQAAQGEARAFVLLWLTVWTLGGAWVMFLVAWAFAGREEVEISAGRVVVGRRLGRWRRAKSFDASRVEEVRVAIQDDSTWDRERWLSRQMGRGPGAVAFDYGARTHRFGSSLDEAEAEMVVERIREVAMNVASADRSLEGARADVEERPDGLVVSMPAKRFVSSLVFLPVWLIGWTYGWVAVDDARAELGLLGPLGTVLALALLLWLAAGREEVEVAAGRLTLRRRVGPLRRERHFDAGKVQDLRAQPSAGSSWFGNTSVTQASMAFEADGRTHRFAGALDEAEAKHLARRIGAALR